MWSLIRVWSPDGHWVKVSLEFIVCVFADRLLSSTGRVESRSKAHDCRGTVCLQCHPKRARGQANDFPGCTDDPQHGLLVSGLAHRTEMPKDSIDSVAAQSQFLPLTLLLLSRLCESVWQNQLQCHYASCITKLQVQNRLLVLCSSEGTVPAKNQLRPLGVSSFALLSIVTEREKKKQEEKWHKYTWCSIDHMTPLTNQCSACNPNTTRRKSLDIFSQNITASSLLLRPSVPTFRSVLLPR